LKYEPSVCGKKINPGTQCQKKILNSNTISKSDTLLRALAKNASGKKLSPSAPIIAIFWIKFTKYYLKLFPVPGGNIESMVFVIC
jgi:hypothetical protein